MVNDLDATFAALADPTRRHVVELLRERPCHPSELAHACGVSSPAMSRHLRMLRATGLIEVETGDERSQQDARLRLYQLRPERFTALSEWLVSVRSFWTHQLDAFKAYAETQSQAPLPPATTKTSLDTQSGERS